MRVSIKNFKSIKSIVDFQIKPLTILSGVNSSGKSSFIQLLLLLKQTIELDSSNHHLYLKGDYYQVKEYTDILFGKNAHNKLKIGFTFEKDELLKINSPDRITLFDSLPTYKCIVEITYDYYKNKEYINEFLVQFILPEGSKREQFVKFQFHRNGQDTYSIEANNELFGRNLWVSPPKITRINYSSIYPISYETVSIIEDVNQKGEKIVEEIKERQFPNIDSVKSIINYFFSNLSYIGPIRDVPKDEYSIRGRHDHVGIYGEYVAEVLENYKDETVEYYKPSFNEDGVQYKLEKDSVLKAVKFWMCDIFKMGKNIRAIRTDDTYSIIIENESKISATVKHVGFGISQILPIIVEGLLMPSTGRLILEQPEIHLHPKLQSLLFDFLYSLVLSGKSIIIETHSDHFISRMRRRIAEDNQNIVSKNIQLTFIELLEGNIAFKNIDVDDFGTFDMYPEDFIERSDIELKAIVRAQMKKRLIKTQK